MPEYHGPPAWGGVRRPIRFCLMALSREYILPGKRGRLDRRRLLLSAAIPAG